MHRRRNAVFFSTVLEMNDDQKNEDEKCLGKSIAEEKGRFFSAHGLLSDKIDPEGNFRRELRIGITSHNPTHTYQNQIEGEEQNNFCPRA